MAESPIPAPDTNGIPMDDDEFEKNLKEILEDGPNLNDMSNTVQGGTPQKGLSQSTYSLSTSSSGYQAPPQAMSRSQTMPGASKPPPIQTAKFNGDFVPKPTMTQVAHSKLEHIKAWSVNTYKCTKQLLSEKLGKSSRTVDLELEAQIEVLRDTQRKYSNILRLSRSLMVNFTQVVQTQRALGEAFSEQAQRSVELQEEFTYNCETQRALVKNGETLLAAINFFVSTVNTLCNKTIEDTLLTVKHYENARLEFDAYRADVEQYNIVPPRDSATIAKAEETKRKFEDHKVKFDRLRGDVAIKLKFLDENRIKVMHKQLLLFHNAVSAYFSGNQTALESTLKQFNIKLKSANSGEPSWLEQ